MEKNEKILFRFYSNIFDDEIVETIWAKEIDKKNGLYKIDNIPFYIPMIASNDIIFAEFDQNEKMLTYRKTVEHSGNTVVQVVIMDSETKTNDIRNLFMRIGCESEKLNDRYFSMEIPFNISYKEIKSKLDKLEKDEIIGYAEPNLSDKHRIEINITD